MRIAILLYFFILPVLSICQNTFHKLYGKDMSDIGNSVDITSDGNYIVAGGLTTYDHQNYSDSVSVYLVLSDQFGDTIWTRTIQMGIEGAGTCVRQTIDSGFIITGSFHHYAYGDNTKSMFLIKLDGNGEVIWSNLIFEEAYATSYCVEQTSDTGYVISGMYLKFNSSFQYNTEIVLIKTDRQGEVVWIQEFGGGSIEHSRSVVQTSDGGYAVFGETYSFNVEGSDFYLIKTDSNGDSMWSKSYGAEHYEWGFELEQTPDNGFIMVGEIHNSQEVNDKIFIVKTNDFGDTLWTRKYTEFSNAAAFSVQQTSDMGYIITGQTSAELYHNPKLLLLKLDQAGNKLWSRYYDNAESVGYSVKQTEDDGYIITGWQHINGSDNDVVLIKTNENGMVSLGTDIKPNDILSVIYPNPFTTSTTLKYTLSEPSSVTISIFNPQGCLIEKIEQEQPKGEQQVHWNAEGLPAGMYYFRIQAGEQAGGGKMVKME